MDTVSLAYGSLAESQLFYFDLPVNLNMEVTGAKLQGSTMDS